MAITAAATLIRLYCKPVAADTTTWTSTILEGYWDRAHERLKQKLCPPFAEADIEALNNDSTNSDSGDDLIARMAALLIYEALPGSGGEAYQKLYRDMFGGAADDGSEIQGSIELLQTGQDSLFDADGNRLSRAASVYGTDVSTPYRVFSRTARDSNGTIVGTTGTLDQFDKL